MRHGVLDERLQQQRRHEARRGGLVRGEIDVEPIAKANPLDSEEAIDELQLTSPS